VLLRRVMWIAVFVMGSASAGQAAEELDLRKAAPDELPTRLIKVLRTTNKAQTNSYVPKVYDIQNTNPYALLRWIRRTAQQEEGAYYFFGKPDADGKVNSGKILVTLPEYMLEGVDELMETVDRAGITSSSGEKFFYRRPKHRCVGDTDFQDLIMAARGTSGDFEVDNEANAFLVYAAPSKVADVQKWLDEFDRPPAQVMVEVSVYEISVDNESKIGLDYVSWKNGPGRNLFAFQAFSERDSVRQLDTGMNPVMDTGVAGGTYGLPGHEFSSSGRNMTWFLDVPSAFFDFLVVKNKARVLTSVKVAARNGLPATITAGDTILYYQTLVGPSAAAGTRPDGLEVDPNGTNALYPDNRAVHHNTANRLLGALSGVRLQVTPTIAESEINLDLETHVVSHTGFDANGVPSLVSRDADTEIRCRDGQEIVLGGYSREVLVQRADKIPILGSLPIIGYLFGGDGNTTERRNVVVVLTPHVINDFAAMQYDPTKINAAMIKSKAMQEADAPVPHTEAGFDQWLMDEEQDRSSN